MKRKKNVSMNCLRIILSTYTVRWERRLSDDFNFFLINMRKLILKLLQTTSKTLIKSILLKQVGICSHCAMILPVSTL